MSLRSVASIRGDRRLIRVMLLVALVLLAVPRLAAAQTPSPSPGDSTAARVQQMMDAFTQGGGMYETMMKAMIQGTLKAMEEPETARRMAAFTRRYYQALVSEGFTRAEALQIVAGVGVPALKMGR